MAIDLIQSTRGMSPQEVEFEVSRGARFILYQYAFSVVIMSFKRNSPVVFVKAGENPVTKSLPWTLLTFLVGWWGFPWGLIYTPQVIYKNLQGGTDVTPYVMRALQATPSSPPPAFR